MEEQPPMTPPPQEPHDNFHLLEDGLYQLMSGVESVGEIEGMDARSVGLIPKELDRCQRKLVERCERDGRETDGGGRKKVGR